MLFDFNKLILQPLKPTNTDFSRVTVFLPQHKEWKYGAELICSYFNLKWLWAVVMYYLWIPLTMQLSFHPFSYYDGRIALRSVSATFIIVIMAKQLFLSMMDTA